MNDVKLNQQALRVMAVGQESERVMCPVCSGVKEVGKLVCPKCFSPEIIKMVKAEIARVKSAAGQSKPTPSAKGKSSKVRFRGRPLDLPRQVKVGMVSYAIDLLERGADAGVIWAAMGKTEDFRNIPEADRRKAVADAQVAIKAASEIETYALEKRAGFDDVDRLVEAFISEKAKDRLSSFVVKAAVYCVILPKLRRKDSFEAKVAEAMAELEAMTLSDAWNTKAEDVRDSLVEAYEGKGGKAGDRYRSFCFAAGAEALKRFRAAHQQEWNAEVDKTLALNRKQTANRFERRGWRVKAANG
jgi:hypothetical protein